MDHLTVAADISIRRACGFAGLGIASVMLALTYDVVLALRVGGDLMAVGCGVLVLAGWSAPRRDLRNSEVWSLLPEAVEARLRQRPKAEWHARVAAVLRARLFWHAERVALGAVALWAAAGLTAFVRSLVA